MLDFSRHALGLGFPTQMVMGIGGRFIPVSCTTRLWSPSAHRLAWWLLNASLLIRSLEAPLTAGYWPQVWPLLALSGPPAVAAFALFAVNIFAALLGRGRPLSVWASRAGKPTRVPLAVRVISPCVLQQEYVDMRKSPRRPGAGRCRVAALAALLALGAASSALAQPPGEIRGAVRLARSVSVPPAITVLNTTDPSACGRVHALQEILVSEPARGVRDAILALEGVPAERVPPRPPGRLVIDNTRCRFEPRVAVATVGGTLEALNSDPVLHTVHLYGALEANLGLPRKGARLTRLLERPGTIVVKCDVHGWMQAYIRVDPHPFHAVTDDQGSFRIRAVPPGEYTLEAWHETLGTLRRTVTVRSQRTTTVDFEYAGAPRSRGE